MTGWTWLNSEYGGDSHGFLDNIPAEQPYLEAPCEHTAPRTKLRPHEDGDPFCVACIIAIGQQIPENRGQDWRTG